MKVCIFDDEPLALEYLAHQLSQLDNMDVLFTSTEPLIHEHMLKDIDIVFSDIEMLEMNGLELAEKILEYNPSIHIVFVTAHNQYAIEAFEMNALDYLLKPVTVDRLKKTIQRINTTNVSIKSNLRDPSTKLRVNVLGELTFQFCDKTKPEDIRWRTAKSKELFLYLLHYESKVVLKSELVEALWNEIDIDKLYSHLYVSIYNIRHSLRMFNDYIKITNIGDGYLLKLHNVILDKKEWKNQLLENPEITIDTLEEQEEIMQLYAGSYLNIHDYIWLQGERFELEEMWLHRSKLIADCYNFSNQFEKAISWYLTIIKNRPEDEHAAFSLMKIYASLHYRMLVDYQYKEIQKSLSELNLEIDPQIADWYSKWKNTTKQQ
ncbi:Two-component response regulator, SAPR family, consists of REC, wHTH and BTAD domains [Gracilibacillus orientalis]|uniref:Two-component response regulator, SAPR family, consists of REC, wHTH and BTAD domains n=1 Tax=Gracilibacillus orientalis TaxID=334253 RepID=A0A1I4R2X1_9BACI|nr:response regulator [Gracilibacillus orientalis]SFM46591.1 Two-component response regulator, SAPR family, consists of REC, wHTH and BTAD domains [Gracilibacillus orientalis]